MASGKELTINNAEEAAVNAPFNSTGLQTPEFFFFHGYRGSMRGSLIRIYGFVCDWADRSPPPTPNLSLDWRAIKVFSSGAHPNGVSNFSSSLTYRRGAVATKKEIMSTQIQNIWSQFSLNSESTDSYKKTGYNKSSQCYQANVTMENVLSTSG